MLCELIIESLFSRSESVDDSIQLSTEKQTHSDPVIYKELTLGRNLGIWALPERQAKLLRMHRQPLQHLHNSFT
jgi:hypothetical protein